MKRSLLLIAFVLLAAALAAATALAGNWKITMQGPRGERTSDMTIVQDGEKLEVTILAPRGEQKFQGSIQGADIAWTGKRQTPNGMEIVVTYKGKVENDLLKGTVQMGERGSFTWSAVRVK
jgi:uncharacterized protein (DUF58 family)